uniref:DRTGG domain-containing protein n=1 Tax=Eutreptiella gymnastica TaxID=73025 RepID=A0A7S4LN30_9EUGL
MPRALFVAATKQHIGKTTTAVGIVAGLKERFKNVGYIKPVGQQHVAVESKDGVQIRVDKDVRLFKEFFDLTHCDYGDMSPLIIPSGYTKQFLDGEVKKGQQIESIVQAFQRVEAVSDFVVIEGTGHCGVGGIVEMDNARVAALLGVDMVLVCNAGIGSSFDELELNRLLCEKHGVNIKGVILNRVQEDKMEETKRYFEKALSRWKGCQLIGCIPYNSYLHAPAMIDYEKLFRRKICAGQKDRMRHFDKRMLMATSMSRFVNLLQMEEHRNTLWVTDDSRTDLVMALAEHVLACKAAGKDWEGGLILGGSEFDDDGAEPLPAVYTDVKRALMKADFPVLRITHDVTEAMKMMNHYTAKLSADDQRRTSAAADHTKPMLDFEKLLA